MGHNARAARLRDVVPKAVSLFDYDLIREEKSGGSIIELNEKHLTVQIVDLAQDAWLFAESAAALVISHRSQQPAIPPHHRLDICAGHHSSRLSRQSSLSG
jgi:hypothetical protein